MATPLQAPAAAVAAAVAAAAAAAAVADEEVHCPVEFHRICWHFFLLLSSQELGGMAAFDDINIVD